MGRDEVVAAAFAVLKKEGLDGLTVRRIAQRLGVENPALYWHFKNKQQIVDAMAAQLLARATVKPGRDWLRRSAFAFRAALLSVRDGARVVASANLKSINLDAAVAQLRSEGFSKRHALAGVVAVFDYTLGATFEQQADPRRKAGDAMFKAGLGFLLAGMEAKRFGAGPA